MPVLHTALPVEARPLRKALGLKQIKSFRTIDIFQKDNTILVVSGVGKVPTAIALSYVGSVFPYACDYFLNIGIAGSCHRDWNLGSAYLISQAKDHSTTYSYHSDLIYQSPWKTASLVTVDRPWEGEPPKNTDLVDMEGSAFFQSALYFAETHQVHSVKLISDYLDGVRCQPHNVENWIGSSIPSILDWMETLGNFQKGRTVFSSPEEREKLVKLLAYFSDNLRLSFTQRSELENALEVAQRRNQLHLLQPDEYLYKMGEEKNKEIGKTKLGSLLKFLYND